MGEQKGRLLWRALEREPITEIWGQSRNCLEAGGILVLEDTFLRCPGACRPSVADLTEATGQRRTFDTAAILSVNGKMALVSPT